MQMKCRRSVIEAHNEVEPLVMQPRVAHLHAALARLEVCVGRGLVQRALVVLFQRAHEVLVFVVGERQWGLAILAEVQL